MPAWINQFATSTNPMGEKALESSQSAEIVSILSAGTFFGALTAAPAGDFLGRRFGLIASCTVFTIGVILQTAAQHIPTFVAGRFFAGYGVGMLSALVPLYQSETAPKWIRGAVVGAYQLAITIGLLIAAIVDNATKDHTNSGAYRIPIAIQFAWAIILVVGMLILPETPRFLVRQGKPEKAAKSLSRLRRLDVDHPALVEELSEITANHEYELSLGKASYIDCFRGGMGKRLFTGCALQALQQLTGVNFIFYYGTSYFKSAGFSNPFIITMITSAVNVASTFPGLYLVEKWGRRWLLMFGAIGMSVCQLIVAIVGTVKGVEDQSAQKAAVAFVWSVMSALLTLLQLTHIQHLHFLLWWARFPMIPEHSADMNSLLVGTCGLGGDGRDFPAQSPGKVSVHDDCIELAPQLGYWLCDALSRQQQPGKCRYAGRRSWFQDLLHLGRLLL